MHYQSQTNVPNSVLLHRNCAESDVGTLVLLELLLENRVPIEPMRSADIIFMCMYTQRKDAEKTTGMSQS